ncbi:MAG: class I SAM-dependent methyltransferase [Planctomycetota bacterium]
MRRRFAARSEPIDAWEDHQRRCRFAAFEALWPGTWPSLEILEVGCGFGGWLLDFRARSETVSLTGVDLCEERLAVARRRLPGARLAIGCGSALPLESDRFDLIVLSTVLSSIASESLRGAIAKEVSRVGRADAWALVFDLRYPNPFNREVRSISRSEVARLFGAAPARSCSALALPPIGRRLARWPKALGWWERASMLHTHRMDLVPLNSSAAGEPTAR